MLNPAVESRYCKRLTRTLLVLSLLCMIATGCAGRAAIKQDAAMTTHAEIKNASATLNDNPDNDWDDDFLDDGLFGESGDSPASPPVQVSDPLKFWNVPMFHLNDKLYLWVVKPVAKGYEKITPEIVRLGIKNFFSNLGAPVRFVNCILQGKGEKAGTELGRFMVNTTLGGLGFVDIAKNQPGLATPDAEDMGQTLGVFGIGNGCYIVWPLLGPSTLRDSVGLVGDYFINPVSYVDEIELTTSAKGVEFINGASPLIENYEALKDAAIIPYDAFRDAYIQLRKGRVEK